MLKTERVEVPSPRVTTTIERPTDGELVVESKRTCSVREWNTVERDLEIGYENKAPWIDIAFVAAALPLTAGGIYALVVAGEVAGDLDLRAFASKREDEAWRGVNLQQCTEAFTLDACTPVETHLREYPDGPHAEDARRALHRAEPLLLKLRDQLAWRRVQGALVTCSGKDAAEATAMEVACGVLGSYVRDFPKGEHAREAESAIALGKARAKDRCVGSCRAYCAKASIAHFDDCFKGCVEGKCSK